MKAQSKVDIRTPAGLVQAPCFHQWKQTVGGMEFEFALHIAAGHTKGFVAPLAISELGTGFDVKATITHPVSRAPLNSSNIQGLKAAQVKSVAHAALHNLINKRVGAGSFLQAMLGAQMQLSKVDLSKYEYKGELGGPAGLASPATANISGTIEVTERNNALLDKLLGTCEVCNGSKVVSTTDKDHEGNNIEITCPACIPKAIELPETKVSDMVTQPNWGSPTEEEWYEGLEPANKLDYLRSKLAERQAYSKALSAKATKTDYDRIDDIDNECREIEEKLKALEASITGMADDSLNTLKASRDALQQRADQHGTMTGDTTEQDYEALAGEIADLDDKIADLEGKPCSN